jgi:hypothetical protein
MSPVREALVLPILLLGVTLGGGFRTSQVDGALQFLPPPLITLVLAVLLLGVLARAGVLVPHLLLDARRRTTLENANGAMVCLTLLLASAQVFNCLSPESGVLQVLASIFFLVLLLNTLVARPDDQRVLQSLGVVFLSAFVLKFVVLEGLYAPDGSMARRLLTTMIEGVSLGALGYTPHGRATGYVAFASILTYLFTLMLLPRQRLPQTWLVASAIDESLAPPDPADR